MQTSYSINIDAVAFPGQKTDIGHDDVISAIATQDIPYGVAVALAGGSYPALQGKLPESGDTILGIAVADQNRAQNPSLPAPTYVATSALGLMREGRIYARVSGAVTVGGPASIVVTPGADQGTLSDAGEALPGAKFLGEIQQLTIAGQTIDVAVVELDL